MTEHMAQSGGGPDLELPGSGPRSHQRLAAVDVAVNLL